MNKYTITMVCVMKQVHEDHSRKNDLFQNFRESDQKEEG